MKTLHKIILAFTVIFFWISPGFGQGAANYGNNPAAGHYILVNGMKMYCEIYGSGKPLVLLHGNGGSIRNQSGRIEFYKDYFKVIAIDSRAHGHSVDPTDTTLTYVQMANDVKVLLDSLHIDSAFVWGQSDGGILGLLLAINYPQKVARLATYGANLYPSEKAVFDEIEKFVMDTLKATTDPRKRNLYQLMAYQPDIKDEDLKKISCPVLVMTGDRDAIRLEHSLEIFYGIRNSNLFVMPGATHFGAYEKPDLFNEVLLDFFTRKFSKRSTVDIFSGK